MKSCKEYPLILLINKINYLVINVISENKCKKLYVAYQTPPIILPFLKHKTRAINDSREQLSTEHAVLRVIQMEDPNNQ
jgi:hypothetical protein